MSGCFSKTERELSSCKDQTTGQPETYNAATLEPIAGSIIKLETVISQEDKCFLHYYFYFLNWKAFIMALRWFPVWGFPTERVTKQTQSSPPRPGGWESPATSTLVKASLVHLLSPACMLITSHLLSKRGDFGALNPQAVLHGWSQHGTARGIKAAPWICSWEIPPFPQLSAPEKGDSYEFPSFGSTNFEPEPTACSQVHRSS